LIHESGAISIISDEDAEYGAMPFLLTKFQALKEAASQI